MTPAEENALIVKVLADSGYQPDHDLDAAGILTIARLAIRAAVAAERERCARVCDKRAETALGCQRGREDDLSNVILRHHAAQATDCAAAIRRGE